jgi:hypothetical protein
MIHTECKLESSFINMEPPYPSENLEIKTDCCIYLILWRNSFSKSFSGSKDIKENNLGGNRIKEVRECFVAMGCERLSNTAADFTEWKMHVKEIQWQNHDNPETRMKAS